MLRGSSLQDLRYGVVGVCYEAIYWRLTVTEPTARQALEFEDIRRAGLRDLSSLGSLGFREFRVLGV